MENELEQISDSVVETREYTSPPDDTVNSLTATGVIITLTSIVVFLALFLYGGGNNKDNNKTAHTATLEATILSDNPFENLSLDAKAVFVWDVNTEEVLFAKNAEAQLPLASLTKLMTALVAYETLPEDTVVVIDNTALQPPGDSGLFVSEKWRLEDLLDFTLLTSSNDGASALSAVAGSFKSSAPNDSIKNNEAFIRQMNQKARTLALTQTYFLNETGLDTSSAVGGGYGSARDIARLLEYIMFNAYELVRATRYHALELFSLDNISHAIKKHQ